MTKAKAGRGAGEMTFRDATNLIIAVAGTSVVRDSHWPVEQLGPLKTKSGAWNLEFAPIAEMTSLGKDHTLGDAIEALLQSASVGSFQKAAGLETADIAAGYRGKI